MPAKGGQFERDICRKLSLWWTEGQRDDVFWRSASSGAMATSRMRTKGRTTYGQHGDIQAVDPIGAPLLKLCCLELKRGYKKWSPMDLVDAPHQRKGNKKPTKQPITEFIEQVAASRDACGARFTVIISRRDNRQAIIITSFPIRDKVVGWPTSGNHSSEMCFTHEGIQWYMYNLDTFLEHMKPQWFKEITDGQ